MPDVFLSYAREDRTRARQLAQALQSSGWEIWWDEHIQPGDSFDRAIERTLAQSTCVVVLWSSHSVDSDFVRAEARWAASHRRLIPVFLDRVDVPIEFSSHQVLDLIGWPSSGIEGYDQLVADLGRRLKKQSRANVSVPKPRSQGFGLWTAGVTVLGCWPFLASILSRSDDPFYVAPMIIAGGLAVLSFLKPITPKAGLVFAIIPYVLNLFGFYVIYGARIGYLFTHSDGVIHVVALIAGLLVTYGICKYRLRETH
jgi:hypothetical protein